MFKISVFTVMLPDLTPGEAAEALNAAGYDGVEWRVTRVPDERRGEAPSFWGNNLCTFAPDLDTAPQATAAAESAGLAINGLGTYIDVGDLNATENAMKYAQICGAPRIRVSPGRWPDGDLTYADSFARARTFLAGVQDLAQHYGIKALIETHQDTITPSASLAYRLVEGFDPECIGVLHDAGNMVVEGYENYRLGFELLGPYLAHVHIKNARYNRPDEGGIWRRGWAALEDGAVDWDALFTALRAVGYKGWLALEDFSAARPSREALKFNLEFLRNVIERNF